MVEVDPWERRAIRLGRVVSSLRTAELRLAWLREALRAMPVEDAAETLERVCRLADGADPGAEPIVHALVELLADPAMERPRDALRAEARARALTTLERLLRRPFSAKEARKARRTAQLPSAADDDSGVALEADREATPTRDVPDYGRGRPLTLGERKSLARRPPPELLPRVLADPHPDVIRMLLASPRLTEDHVVSLCVRRPGRAEVLHEVARHPRWCHRPRVRMALVQNPATPPEVAITLVALLRVQELRSVVDTLALHPSVRAAATERLERRPPVRKPPEHGMQ